MHYNTKAYNENLNRKPMSKEPINKEPWWLKPFLVLFVTLVVVGFVSMCNHALKESSGVGVETTIRDHGN